MISDNERSIKTKILGGYLEFVDSTRFFTTPFSWLFLIVAVSFLALPVLVLVKGINFDVFSSGGKIVFGFILILMSSVAAAVVAFLVAWNGRKKEDVEKITIEFIIDSLADLQALFIKSVAHFIAIFGFFAGLFALIFGHELIVMFGCNLSGVTVMVGSVLGAYAMVWLSKLHRFLFSKLSKITVKVIVQVFRFIVLHAVVIIYNFIAHIVKQLFDYFFALLQAIVDFIANSLKVIIALAARLGRFLFAYARSPFKNRESNNANVTPNE